ncbi:hypothetical protein ACJ41O_012964 [Fusarium nematophilum]
MTNDLVHTESEPGKRTRRRCRFWVDYNEEVRHLEIDYNIREREKQITKIVNDGGFKIRVFFVAASGFLASSYSLFAVDILSIALFYVYPPCGRLGDNPSLLIDELTLVGTILGMLLMGHLADRSGRKKWYGAELAILIVATMGMVQSSPGFMFMKTEDDKDPERSMNVYSWIAWWRFLLGIGIGAEYPLSSIITAEWASTESRGVMLSAVFSMQSVGRLLSFAVSLGSLHQNWNMPKDDSGWESQKVTDIVWRWTVGVALIPAAIAILLRLTIPETPRFYAGIMKDSRKGVLNAMSLYGRNKNIQEMNSNTDTSRQERSDQDDEPWYTWYKTAWRYLTDSDTKGWKPLLSMSLLWAIMDIPWYGLTMDLSSALAILMHDPEPNTVLHEFRRASETSNGTCGDNLWNKDFWNKKNTIHPMIEQNALRSIVVVSIASLMGSLGSILIIDFFRRKIILITTFFIISVLLAITGGTLLTEEHESHLAAIICYAILQFVFNLGPNTLIFVLAAEIFPTTYRGTFNGIAAASGKIGAVIIRIIIAETKKHGEPGERELGIRLLALIPLMLLSAWISWYLPDVQVIPKSTPKESASEEQSGSFELASGLPPPLGPQTEPRPSDAASVSSSDGSAAPPPTTTEASGKYGLLRRLKNIPLEDIAPNPTRERRRSKRSTEGAVDWEDLSLRIVLCRQLWLTSEYRDPENEKDRFWYWPRGDMRSIDITGSHLANDFFKSFLEARAGNDSSVPKVLEEFSLVPLEDENSAELDCTPFEELKNRSVLPEEYYCQSREASSSGSVVSKCIVFVMNETTAFFPLGTSPADTTSLFALFTGYFDVLEQVSRNHTELAWLERLWAAWYLFMQNDTYATGIMTFVLHEVFYFGRCIPFMVMDKIPYFSRYKIQAQKLPTLREQWHCAMLVLVSHFTAELPQIWFFHPVATYFGIQYTVPFPPCWKIAAQISLFFVLEDTWHYWAHRALHYGPLYKSIHKMHHTYSAPFGLAAEYASPIETAILGFGVVGSPVVMLMFTGDLHLFTMYVWMMLRLFQAIDAHSGYDFPWSLRRILPFWAGADHHDLHHEKFIGNYASSFRWWDYCLDTEAGLEASKRRRERKLARMRGMKQE